MTEAVSILNDTPTSGFTAPPVHSMQVDREVADNSPLVYRYKYITRQQGHQSKQVELIGNCINFGMALCSK